MLVWAGLWFSFVAWSWWPLAGSFAAFAVIHASISAWSTPVAVAEARRTPKWVKVALWLLFLFLALSILPLFFDLTSGSE